MGIYFFYGNYYTTLYGEHSVYRKRHTMARVQSSVRFIGASVPYTQRPPVARAPCSGRLYFRLRPQQSFFSWREAGLKFSAGPRLSTGNKANNKKAS